MSFAAASTSSSIRISGLIAARPAAAGRLTLHRRVGAFGREESPDHFWTQAGPTRQLRLAQAETASLLIQCADDGVNLIDAPPRGSVREVVFGILAPPLKLAFSFGP